MSEHMTTGDHSLASPFLLLSHISHHFHRRKPEVMFASIGTGIGVAPSTGVAAAPGAGLTYTPSTSGRSGSNIYGSSGTYGYGSTTGAPGYGTSGGSSTGYPSGYSSFTPASAAAPSRCSARIELWKTGHFFGGRVLLLRCPYSIGPQCGAKRLATSCPPPKFW